MAKLGPQYELRPLAQRARMIMRCLIMLPVMVWRCKIDFVNLGNGDELVASTAGQPSASMRIPWCR